MEQVKKIPKVLVACEESQAVTIEFRKLGIQAYSCDIIDCSGGHQEWHIKQDVLPLLDGDYEFMTTDGMIHSVNGNWDMIIAFPPCTYLTVAGNRWFDVAKYGQKAVERKEKQKEAIKFFLTIASADCNKIAIENPVGIMSTFWRKPDQVIQPYYFKENARKKTCLWLKNIDHLHPTGIVDPGKIAEGGYSIGASADYARNSKGRALRWSDPETARQRSKTFPGIAKAMAEQWGGELLHSFGSDI